MNLVPREAVWPGQLPTNTNGTPRPKLAPNRPWYTIHYTGGGIWLDPDDTVDELRSIQNYAQSAGKPWEYNWVIDGQGTVWEYAGNYQAAHSGGENDKAIGVLLLVGFKGTYPNDIDYWEQPTPEMINAVRDLRAFLVDHAMLAGNHTMLPHQGMPGAATACPGNAVMAVWPQLTAPPTPPTPPGDNNVELVEIAVTGRNARFLGYLIKPTTTATDGTRQREFILWAEWVNGADPIQDTRLNAYRNMGIPVYPVGDMTGIGLLGPIPVGDTLWNWTRADFGNLLDSSS